MRTVFLLSGLLMTLSALPAQDMYTGRVVDSAYLETIPYRYVGGKMLIPVTIDSITYWFMLDTGGELIVSPRVRDAHRLERVGEKSVRGAANDRSSLEKVAFPDMHIGNLTFSGYQGLVTDFFDRYPVVCFGADGMLGRDFLKTGCLRFDHPNRQIIFADKIEQLDTSGHRATEIVLGASGSPYIPVHARGGKPEMVLFDSGSDDFFSFQRKKAEKWSAPNKSDKQTWVGVSSLGITLKPAKHSKQYRIRLDSLTISGVAFQDVRTDVSKESRSRVGTRFLHYGLVTIDFSNKQFYFKPFPDSVFQQTGSHYGMALEILEGDYRVRAVLKGSEADRAGISEGTVIRSIDGYTPGKNRAEHCAHYLNGHPWDGKPAVEVIFIDRRRKEKKVVLNRRTD